MTARPPAMNKAHAAERSGHLGVLHFHPCHLAGDQDRSSEVHRQRWQACRGSPPSPALAVADALTLPQQQPLLLELIGTMRFAGFDIGVPSASEPRWDFIVNRLITSAWCYIGWDILDVAVKHPLVNPATHLGIGSLKICREGPLGLFAEALGTSVPVLSSREQPR